MKNQPVQTNGPPHAEAIAMGVILSRQEIDSPWADHIWKPVSVILDGPSGMHGKVREKGPGWVHFFADADPLELHRKDAPAYADGLNGEDALWVVLEDEDDPAAQLPYKVHLVTASPYEAQDYLDSGETIVEAVPMPAMLRAYIKAFVARCPPEEKFIKRKQKKTSITDHTFGQQPVHEIRKLSGKE